MKKFLYSYFLLKPYNPLNNSTSYFTGYNGNLSLFHSYTNYIRFTLKLFYY